MKVKTNELSDIGLDWAVAKSVGRYSGGIALTATNQDVKDFELPFTLWETNQFFVNDKLVKVTVTPITVNKFGVNVQDGTSEPTIQFTDVSGVEGVGAVNLYYLLKEDAEKAADFELNGFMPVDFNPSLDWADGGPILEVEQIWVKQRYENIYDAYKKVPYDSESKGFLIVSGKTYLEAAMRCVVTSKLGNTVDIPNELVNSWPLHQSLEQAIKQPLRQTP